MTTVDFDFMFRDTPVSLVELKRFARTLGAVVFRPYYPVSGLYRVVDDDAGLQVDFMPVLHGIRSFERLRSRAVIVQLGREKLRVAALEDIIRSKAAAARRRDLAVLPVLEATLREKARAKKPVDRSRSLAVLRAESERDLVDLIRRLLALPMERRTHFLRKRLPGGGSAA